MTRPGSRPARAAAPVLGQHTPTARVFGRVVRVTEKGFGFIREEHSGQEYFVHHSNCTAGSWDEITEMMAAGDGQVIVSFEPADTVKGPRAMRVELEDGGDSALGRGRQA